MFTVYKDRVYPFPINLATISEYVGRHLTPTQAREWVAEHAAEVPPGTAGNLEEGDLADRATRRRRSRRLQRSAGPVLQWRTLGFEQQVLDAGDVQGTPVRN